MLHKNQRVIIDEIEANIARVENEAGEMLEIPQSILPPGAKENDCLVLIDGLYVIDTEATQERKQTNLDLYKKLLGKKEDE